MVATVANSWSDGMAVANFVTVALNHRSAGHVKSLFPRATRCFVIFKKEHIPPIEPPNGLPRPENHSLPFSTSCVCPQHRWYGSHVLLLRKPFGDGGLCRLPKGMSWSRLNLSHPQMNIDIYHCTHCNCRFRLANMSDSKRELFTTEWYSHWYGACNECAKDRKQIPSPLFTNQFYESWSDSLVLRTENIARRHFAEEKKKPLLDK